MYEELTRLIPLVEEADGYGEWIIDREHAGTMEDPKQMPFVAYSRLVIDLEYAVYAFIDRHPEMGLTSYSEILEHKGVCWESKSMQAADVSEFDGASVMALLVGAIRAERFCDGALLHFLDDGCIERWLRRLEEIDADPGEPLPDSR